jgi:hypothetical protein
MTLTIRYELQYVAKQNECFSSLLSQVQMDCDLLLQVYYLQRFTAILFLSFFGDFEPVFSGQLEIKASASF